MADDSVSEITDLEKEEVMAKYYEDKLTGPEKNKRDRIAARKRLLGETEVKRHVCTTTHKKGKGGIGLKTKGDETIEL